MKVSTSRFGELEVSEEKIIHFPHGILGFEGSKKFIFLEFSEDPNSTIKWFQNIEIPDLSFILAHPGQFFNDYSYILNDEYLKILDTDKSENLITFIILSFYEGGNIITANLMAPIIINSEKSVGIQAILEENFSTRHQIYPPLKK